MRPIIDIQAFYSQRLKDYDFASGFSKSIATNFPNETFINILSIGCGSKPIEYAVLQDFFYPKKVFFVGIDIEEKEIEHCRKIYANDPNAEFHIADATNSKVIKNIFKKKPIHIIVSRHPELYSNMEELRETVKIFEKIFFSSIPKLLAKGGTLLVSNFLKEEKEKLQEILSLISSQPYSELPEIENALFTTVYSKTHLTDITRHLYYDKYFTGISNFKPKLVLDINKKIDTKSHAFMICQQHIAQFLNRQLTQNEQAAYNTAFKTLIALFMQVIAKNDNLDHETICEKISEHLIESTSVNSTQIDIFNFELTWSEWHLKRYSSDSTIWNYALAKISKSLLQAALNSMPDIEMIPINCQDALRLETKKPIPTKFFEPQNKNQNNEYHSTQINTVAKFQGGQGGYV